MAEQHYDLFFKGQILEGQHIDFVKADIQTLFKAKTDYVEKLFSGQEQVIKRKVDKATAIKFQQAFKKAGAKLIVKAHAAQSATAPAPASEPAPQSISKPTAPEQQPVAPVAASTGSPLFDLTNAAVQGENDDQLIEHHQPDIHAPTTTPNWDVAAPGATLTESQPVEAVTIDTSELSLAEAGADLIGQRGFEEPAPIIQTDGITLAETGATIETLKDDKPPVSVDISHLSVEP